MRPRLLLLPLLLLATALPLAAGLAAPAYAATGTPSPSAPGIGISLVDIPAATQDDPRARNYIVDNLPPGTSIHRRVHVSNGTAQTQEVRMYIGSARIVDGGFVGDDPGSVNELAQWTSVDRPELTLQPGAEQDVLVSVDVPADAAEGEQYAAVWSEIRTRTPGQDVTTASRVGVRMYVSVAPGNGPAADFRIEGLRAERSSDGTPVVTAEVENTGGRALDLAGRLELADGPSGLSAGPFDTEATTTLPPGGSGRIRIALGADLPDGPWQAHLALTSGLLTHEISGAVTFAAEGRASVAAGGDASWIPAATLGGAALVLAVVALALFLRRKRTPPLLTTARR